MARDVPRGQAKAEADFEERGTVAGENVGRGHHQVALPGLHRLVTVDEERDFTVTLDELDVRVRPFAGHCERTPVIAKVSCSRTIAGS